MQRKLADYLQKCTEMCDKLNIPVSHDIKELSVSHAERRWGRTSWRNGISGTREDFKISISYKLINPKYTETDEGLINTMIHELLHTCPKCNGHGATWKMYANQIYNAYGIDIKRCGSDDDKGCNEEKIKESYKYIIECTKCKQTIGRYKMSKHIAHPDWFVCGKCGGALKRIK